MPCRLINSLEAILRADVISNWNSVLIDWEYYTKSSPLNLVALHQ